MVTILGIDPGSRITGYGLLKLVGRDYQYLASGYIKLSDEEDFAKRLQLLYSELTNLVKLYSPQEVALEQVFVHVNVSSALKLGHVRGVAMLGAKTADNQIFEYTPRAIKQSVTGYGNAEKQQIQKMVSLLLKVERVLQVDEADALAIAYCHSVMRGQNVWKFKG